MGEEDLKFIVVHTKEQQVSGYNKKGGCRNAVCGKMKGSVMVIDFATRELLEEYLKSEPYIQANVWANVKAEPMNVVILNGEKVGK